MLPLLGCAFFGQKKSSQLLEEIRLSKLDLSWLTPAQRIDCIGHGKNFFNRSELSKESLQEAELKDFEKDELLYHVSRFWSKTLIGVVLITRDADA